MIPATAHFLWLSPSFPWVHVLALRSAARRGGFERVVVHHTHDLGASLHWEAAMAEPRVEATRLDEAATLEAVPDYGGRLIDRLGRLDSPASRANLLRAAILSREGGVYLDFDTITLKSLTELRRTSRVFCGTERIVFPATVRRSRNPVRLAAAYTRVLVRDALRRAPDGWRHFRRVERHYPTAVNNAVFAAAPGHPLVAELLRRAATLPEAAALRRYALGTHLLQDVVGSYEDTDLTVTAPEVFYPLPPEISEHWFRERARVDIDAMLHPDTRVVHWYASVRTRGVANRIEPDFVRAHALRQPFSALALEFAL